MKIGVIGLGSIGKRHAVNLQALGHEVVGYDPIWEARGAFPGKALTEDAYVIASPTKNHYQHLRACMMVNKPVFVEKPVSHVYDPAIGTWGNIYVGYNLRFHPCIIKSKEVIDSGKIGKPLWAIFACCQFNNKPDYLRDGVILNWSHEVDLAMHLLGDAWVDGSSTRVIDGQDDMTSILLTHSRGCRTIIKLDYITKPERRSFTIYGDKGSIDVATTGRAIALQPEGIHKSFDGSYDTDYIDEMKAFIDAIEGKQTRLCTGTEAIKTLEICLQVRKQAGLS